MAPELHNQCVSCGVALVIGAFFHDYISEFRERGLRRTLYFDMYRQYEDLFGHPHSDEWPAKVTPEECDSVFLGDVIDTDMLCPKCGESVFRPNDA